jgi:hypothetical protein
MVSARGKLSTQDKFAVLNCRRLPGRLNSSETALLLGLQEHDIAPLVAAKLLVPLGKPAPNAPKYFATVDITARAEDRDWLFEATKVIAKFWLRKNRRCAAANCHATVSGTLQDPLHAAG